MDSAILADDPDNNRRRLPQVTETHTTLVPATPIFPPGRYGRRRAVRPRRPWVTVLVVVVIVAAMSLVSARLYRQYGDPAYDAQIITYTQITDEQIVIDFRVTVPAGGSAICVLRARSRDGAEVAREEVRITAPAGETHPAMQHRLATTGRPIIGEVLRCRAAG
jgi:hypothetical protein